MIASRTCNSRLGCCAHRVIRITSALACEATGSRTAARHDCPGGDRWAPPSFAAWSVFALWARLGQGVGRHRYRVAAVCRRRVALRGMRTSVPLASIVCGYVAHSNGRITSEWSRRAKRCYAIMSPWRAAHSERWAGTSAEGAEHETENTGVCSPRVCRAFVPKRSGFTRRRWLVGARCGDLARACVGRFRTRLWKSLGSCRGPGRFSGVDRCRHRWTGVLFFPIRIREI